VGCLRARRPAAAVVAEEGSAVAGRTGVRWYVDPLDGTINFLYGIPHWCVAICCADARGAVAAIVYDPLRGELFTAKPRAGAWLHDAPVATTGTRQLAEGHVATGL